MAELSPLRALAEALAPTMAALAIIYALADQKEEPPWLPL